LALVGITDIQRDVLVREFDPVYERIAYRGAIIPSCDSERLLQTFVGRSGAEVESLH
jgi:hypothetical protein